MELKDKEACAKGKRNKGGKAAKESPEKENAGKPVEESESLGEEMMPGQSVQNLSSQSFESLDESIRL